MAWNEPGRGPEPWRGRRGAAGDLDAFLRELQQRFGGGGSEGAAMLGLLGAFTEVTGPGLHWRIPWPVETAQRINISEVRKYPNKTVMLTQDETVVSVEVEVQYRAADPKAFMFAVRDPDETLGEVVNSAIREVIGRTNIDDIIEGPRAEVVQRARELTQNTLDAYGTGLVISSFNLTNVQLPDQVQDAQRDAIKAREDKETAILAAQAYTNDILPKARGQAAREIQDAEAFKARVVAEADGESARFTKLLAEYQKAPGVTRERLYLDAMEQVLGANAKVLVTTKGQGNLLYLPLDQLRRTTLPPLAPSATPPASETQEARSRNRGGR